MTDAIGVKLATTPEQLAGLRPQWSAVLRGSDADGFFLTWEWVAAWAQSFVRREERSLFILAVLKGDQIIGIAPFYIERRRVGPLRLRELRLLGHPQGGSDYLDVFCARGREKAVAETVYDFLFGQGRGLWDRLLLTDVRAESLFLLHFSERLDQAGKPFAVALSAYCPLFRVARAGGDLLSSLSANRREQFRRHRRILAREPGVARERHSARQEPQALRRFFELYERATPYEGAHLESLLERLLEDLPAEADVQIDAVASNGRWVAALLHLRHRDTLHMYLMAVDKGFLPKISVGNVLVGESIEAAIADGVQVYDFLKGVEDYKFHWANGGERTLRLSLYNRRPLPWLVMTAELVKAAVKSAIR